MASVSWYWLFSFNWGLKAGPGEGHQLCSLYSLQAVNREKKVNTETVRHVWKQRDSFPWWLRNASHFTPTLYVHEVLSSTGGLPLESCQLPPLLYWPPHAALSLDVSRDSKLVISHWKVLTVERRQSLTEGNLSSWMTHVLICPAMPWF